MIDAIVGRTITGPILYCAAALVAVLVGIILTLLGALWWVNDDLKDERKAGIALQEKNARCEAEAGRLKGSVDAQNTAVSGVKSACEAAKTAAETAKKIAEGQRPVTAKQIADILAGKPQDADSCKAACIEMRRELKR